MNKNEMEDISFFGMILLLVVIFFSTQGCASVKTGWSGTKEHKPLLQQIVKMRTGYKGLTHKTCVEFDWFGQCEKKTVMEYDMNDAAVRARFVELNFVCDLGGRRYKIDPAAPQFVRYDRVKRCWFCEKKTEKTEPMPYSDTQKLLDGDLTCWSEREYPAGIP